MVCDLHGCGYYIYLPRGTGAGIYPAIDEIIPAFAALLFPVIRYGSFPVTNKNFQKPSGLILIALMFNHDHKSIVKGVVEGVGLQLQKLVDDLKPKEFLNKVEDG